MMKLDDIKYDLKSSAGWTCGRIWPHLRVGLVYRRFIPGTDKLEYCVFDGKGNSWLDLDKLTAQAVLFELTKNETPSDN